MYTRELGTICPLAFFFPSFTVFSASELAISISVILLHLWCIDPSQNHYTHEITIFELFRGLQLQLSGVVRINYSYNFLVVLAESSHRK